jgi:hypothetical protein
VIADGPEPIELHITGPMETGTDDNGQVWYKQEQYTLLLWPNGNVSWKRPE